MERNMIHHEEDECINIISFRDIINIIVESKEKEKIKVSYFDNRRLFAYDSSSFVEIMDWTYAGTLTTLFCIILNSEKELLSFFEKGIKKIPLTPDLKSVLFSDGSINPYIVNKEISNQKRKTILK